jgi:antitoxin MazE
MTQWERSGILPLTTPVTLTVTLLRNYNVIMKTSLRKKLAAHKSPAKTAVKGRLVRIGNSRGIRLPKTLLEQSGLTTDVEITVKDAQIIIRSAGKDTPRAGWEEQIKKTLQEHGEDIDPEWLDAKLSSKFDEKEWTW